LRVEAAALAGRPVAFIAFGPWRAPWRMSDASSRTASIYLIALMGLGVLILGGAAVLAMRNIRDGRGDRRGALRLASYMTVILLALWACTVHVVLDVVLIATFLIAIATAIFYGVLIWTIYLAV